MRVVDQNMAAHNRPLVKKYPVNPLIMSAPLFFDKKIKIKIPSVHTYVCTKGFNSCGVNCSLREDVSSYRAHEHMNFVHSVLYVL